MVKNMTIMGRWSGRMVRPIRESSEMDTCREKESSTWIEEKDNTKESLKRI